MARAARGSANATSGTRATAFEDWCRVMGAYHRSVTNSRTTRSRRRAHDPRPLLARVKRGRLRSLAVRLALGVHGVAEGDEYAEHAAVRDPTRFVAAGRSIAPSAASRDCDGSEEQADVPPAPTPRAESSRRERIRLASKTLETRPARRRASQARRARAGACADVQTPRVRVHRASTRTRPGRASPTPRPPPPANSTRSGARLTQGQRQRGRREHELPERPGDGPRKTRLGRRVHGDRRAPRPRRGGPAR